MKRFLPVVIIIAVLIVALGGAAMLMREPVSTPSPALSTATPTQRVVQTEEQPVHFKGRIDAPLQLEEFGDYQCPPCGQFHPVVQRVVAQYGDRVRFSFRNFPLVTIHKFAAEAARAAEAAGAQGKFWEMHDLLYERQQEWSKGAAARPFILKYAQELGLDMNRFTQDIDGAVAGMRVAQDESVGRIRGVTGTPTLYLNGREVPFEQFMDYDKLRAVIDAALAGKS
ncbi:MAG TPA: thioredoxin domain-containing protein [Pyrinomonadaceae bacterium]|jgi:protein-disulfide isomerase